MRGRAVLASVGLTLLSIGCARDNPLFGAGADASGGGSGGVGDGVVTGSDDLPVATGTAGTGGMGGSGSTGGASTETTGVQGDSTGKPSSTNGTRGETDPTDTATDPEDLVLFAGPVVFGDFLAEAPPGATYPAATEACVEHVLTNGMPCEPGALIMALIRAEPLAAFEPEVLPKFIAGRRVVGPTGTVIADDIQALGNEVLQSTFTDAGVVEGPFWTGGYVATGGVATDCDDWSTQLDSGWTGDPDTLATFWFEAADLDCDEPLPIVCGCGE